MKSCQLAAAGWWSELEMTHLTALPSGSAKLALAEPQGLFDSYSYNRDKLPETRPRPALYRFSVANAASPTFIKVQRVDKLAYTYFP